MSKYRASLIAKVVVPLVAAALVLVALVLAQSSSLERQVFRAESEARAVAAFHRLEASIAAAGGEVDGPLRTLERDAGLVDAIIVAGPDGVVAAASDPASLGSSLSELPDREAGRPPTVTINVSGRQLAAGGVPSIVRAGIVAHRLDPQYITIELTESVLLDDIGLARTALDELKDLGVKLAIDDFGTGYSSLTYLRQFPIDVVKVDQSFVRNLGQDQQDSTIVAAVIAMARALGLRVVCEGVETAEQVAGLVTLGADDGQGWFFAKALEAEAAGAVFANGLDILDETRSIVATA